MCSVKTVLESMLFIFVSRPFATGDRIELRSHAEGELEVYSIALLTTTFRDFYNKAITITSSATCLTPRPTSLTPLPRPSDLGRVCCRPSSSPTPSWAPLS